MDNKKVKTVSLRLTQKALDIMKEISQEQGISMTSVVEMALRRIYEESRIK